MEKTIADFIQNELNAQIKIHSAKAEFVGLDHNKLTIKLMGGCSGCPSSLMAIFNNVTPILKEKFPSILDIELAV